MRNCSSASSLDYLSDQLPVGGLSPMLIGASTRSQFDHRKGRMIFAENITYRMTADAAMLEVLKLRKQSSKFTELSDWIFASPV
jgi:hypothetical protein